MTHEKNPCPFEIGQEVVYRPSARGLALDIMALPSQKLMAKKTYRVKEIQKGVYVVVEGYEHSGGGIYWTEFQSVK